MSELAEVAELIEDSGIVDDIDEPERDDIIDEEDADDDDEVDGERRKAARSEADEIESSRTPDPFEPYRPTVTQEQVQYVSHALQQEYQTLAQQLQHMRQVDAQIPWDQLRVQDPMRWQELQTYRQQAMAHFQQRAMNFEATKGQVQNALAQEQARGHQHQLTVEGAKVARALGDDWNDRTKAEIAGFLQDLGYSNEQIVNVTARDVILAYKALQADRPDDEPARRSIRRRPSPSKLAEREIQQRNLMEHSLQAAELRISAAIDEGRLKTRIPAKNSYRSRNVKIPGGLSVKEAGEILERMM